MTVFFSKKCELGLQAVLFLSTYPNNTLLSSESISKELNAPKDFISKILQSLTKVGIVGSKKGKDGGFYLLKEPNDIRLIDIIRNLDGLDAFNRCVLGFEKCSSKNPCPVHNNWEKLRLDALELFSSGNLSDFKEVSKKKIISLKK